MKRTKAHKKRRLPKGIFRRGGILWIRYKTKDGKLVRESAGCSSVKLAEDLYRKRKTEIAEGRHFPSRKFDTVTFGKLLDSWWQDHCQHKASKFEYLLPRLARFRKTRARDITSDMVQEFLCELRDTEMLSPSSVNHYRTMMNSTFNFAIRRKKFDYNPVAAVHQLPEPPGRDRFTSGEELRALLEACDGEGDRELKAFIIIAATTGLRKGSILPRKYSEVHLEDTVPYVYVGKTKNGEPIKIPLCQLAIDAIKELPSHGRSEYLFPAKPNVRFKEDFKRPYAWDLGKRFRRVCRLAKVENLRIHDLRHYATTVLFMRGIPDSIISKMTGHKSRELKRYQHLSPLFKQQTVELIAQDLSGSSGTISGTVARFGKNVKRTKGGKSLKTLAEPTGLEPATSDVTGRRSNQLNYDSA